MKLPTSLIHKIQYDFAAARYKSGVHVFNSVDETTVGVVISSFLEWAEEGGLIVDGTIDISTFIKE